MKVRIVKFVQERKKRIYIVSNKTIFHPKSGGQPSDVGLISSDNFKVQIMKAMLYKGRIIHFGKILEGEPRVEPVTIEINWKWRYLLMRRHTAGHLLDHCIEGVTSRNVFTTDSWLGDNCYAGYRGDPPAKDETLKVEALANKIIDERRKVKISFIDKKELLNLASEAPNIHRLPEADKYRLVQIEGCKPIPCTGTHVKKLDEIGKVKIKETRKTGSSYKLYFDVETSSNS